MRKRKIVYRTRNEGRYTGKEAYVKLWKPNKDYWLWVRTNYHSRHEEFEIQLTYTTLPDLDIYIETNRREPA
jgi:hypothetical protein